MATTQAPTVQERIALAAPEHTSLLKTLSETDYAPSALSQSSSYIRTLDAQLAEKRAIASQLDAQRKSEQASHEKYRDSTMRRLAFKLSGKKGEFADRAARGEREYFDAVQGHFVATRCVEEVQAELAEARETRGTIEAAAERRRVAQERLDRLHEEIFEGPTPGFPEEDEVELEVAEARAAYDEVQGRLATETQVLRVVERAGQVMLRALQAMGEAEGASRADVWGLGGSFADLAERSALARAEQSVEQVEMLMQRARGMSREVGSLGPMRIAAGQFMGDVLFDNVFSDLAFHRVIQESAMQVSRAAGRLREEEGKAGERVGRVKVDADAAARRLRGGRERLHEVRQGVFERVAGGLPAYEP